jgi:hypothetical protein
VNTESKEEEEDTEEVASDEKKVKEDDTPRLCRHHATSNSLKNQEADRG